MDGNDRHPEAWMAYIEQDKEEEDHRYEAQDRAKRREYVAKSPFTFSYVSRRAFFLYSSKLLMASSIFLLCLMTVFIIFLRATSFFTTLSIMFIIFGLIFFFMPWKRSVKLRRDDLHSAMF